MASRTASQTARYCNYCANSNHRQCSGECECADRKHDPEVRVAAAMRLYQRPDLHRDNLPVETLATQWRVKDSR